MVITGKTVAKWAAILLIIIHLYIIVTEGFDFQDQFGFFVIYALLYIGFEKR